MKFLNKKHEERYEELLRKGNIKGDIEREIAMYILSGNDNLYSKSSKLYDFEENQFVFDLETSEDGQREIVWKVGMSSSEERLCLLAFSLYAGSNKVGVVELFRVLDKNNTRLALNALEIAYAY